MHIPAILFFNQKPSVDAFARKISVAVRERAMKQKSSRSYACIHWRIGDWKWFCDELFRTSVADMKLNATLKAKYERGSGCFQEPPVLLKNIQSQNLSDLLIYVSTVDASALHAKTFQGLELVTIQDYAELRSSNGSSSSKRWPLPQVPGVDENEVMRVIDQAVCSGADVLLLNDFSTYSGIE